MDAGDGASVALNNLLLQTLSCERNGVLVYISATRAARSKQLSAQWRQFLIQTEGHVHLLENLCSRFAVDTSKLTVPSSHVYTAGGHLVRSIEEAIAGAGPALAEIVACRAVLEVETADHWFWGLIGAYAAEAAGTRGSELKRAFAKVEAEEDLHLFQCEKLFRHLWRQYLGIGGNNPGVESPS
jgi:hypothetical protein